MKVASVESKFSTANTGEQFIGVIEKPCDAGWVTTGPYFQCKARQASSCLLLPQSGDRVLVFMSGDECWILAVLDRKGTEPLKISSSHDLVLQSVDGSVRVNGRKGVDIESRNRVSVESADFRLSSAFAEVITGKLNWLGQQVEAHFGAVRLFGRLFESVVERFSRKSRSSFREVEEIDQVRSKHVDYRADGNMCLRGRTVLAKGKDLVKVDGDQIHMG